MEIKTLENLLNKPFNDMKLYYIGIFVREKTAASKCIKKSEKLEDYFSKMIERSLEINTDIKNFNAEFLFSGGKDFSIMIYYITTEIAIGIIHIGKPNFSLLKITAQDLAKELEKYEKDLLLYYEEYLKPAEKQLNSEEVVQEKEDIPKDTLKSTENVSQASESQKNNIIENRPPSLEEILSTESNIKEERSVAPSIKETLEPNQSKKRKKKFFQKGNMTNLLKKALPGKLKGKSEEGVQEKEDIPKNTLKSTENVPQSKKFFQKGNMTNLLKKALPGKLKGKSEEGVQEKEDIPKNTLKSTENVPQSKKFFQKGNMTNLLKKALPGKLKGKSEEGVQEKEDIPKNTLKSTENVPQSKKFFQKGNMTNLLKKALPGKLKGKSEEGVQEKEDLSNINDILNDIEKEFIKIIGPFGKYIFKKRKEEFFQKESITKFSVLKFIDSLAEEIPEIKKRDLFIENAKNFLINL